MGQCSEPKLFQRLDCRCQSPACTVELRKGRSDSPRLPDKIGRCHPTRPEAYLDCSGFKGIGRISSPGPQCLMPAANVRASCGGNALPPAALSAQPPLMPRLDQYCNASHETVTSNQQGDTSCCTTDPAQLHTHGPPSADCKLMLRSHRGQNLGQPSLHSWGPPNNCLVVVGAGAQTLHFGPAATLYNLTSQSTHLLPYRRIKTTETSSA